MAQGRRITYRVHVDGDELALCAYVGDKLFFCCYRAKDTPQGRREIARLKRYYERGPLIGFME